MPQLAPQRASVIVYHRARCCISQVSNVGSYLVLCVVSPQWNVGFGRVLFPQSHRIAHDVPITLKIGFNIGVTVLAVGTSWPGRSVRPRRTYTRMLYSCSRVRATVGTSKINLACMSSPRRLPRPLDLAQYRLAALAIMAGLATV